MLQYLRLRDGDGLPDVTSLRPFKAIVIVKEDVTPDWRNAASEWLVHSGCLYMLGWGIDCSSWDDSVDWAELEAHDFNHIPKSEDVMTTWHEKDTLEEVFQFAKTHAVHSVVPLENVLMLHIGAVDKRVEFLEQYLLA